MSGIKNLADELRSSMKKENAGATPAGKSGAEPFVKKTAGKGKDQLEKLFDRILEYELSGREKLLIRLDDKTIFLLKQLKVLKGIDMNKIIAYSLHQFLKSHPELIRHIKELIKNLDL